MTSLDIIQYAFMLACAPLAITIILVAVPFSQSMRHAVGVVLAAWFALTALTQIPNVGPLPGGLFGIVLPVILVSLFMTFSPIARQTINVINMPLLVSLHITRLAGGLFLLLALEGRLSNPFAFYAGWGDILAATLAIPAALIAWRANPGWEKWVLSWNVIGFVDFVSAVSLGTTSATGSPLQLFFEAPGTGILGELPWRFIPSYFVPLYIMIHIALFIRLVPAVFGKPSLAKSVPA
jgi:hypothetical protein